MGDAKLTVEMSSEAIRDACRDYAVKHGGDPTGKVSFVGLIGNQPLAARVEMKKNNGHDKKTPSDFLLMAGDEITFQFRHDGVAITNKNGDSYLSHVDGRTGWQSRMVVYTSLALAMDAFRAYTRKQVASLSMKTEYFKE